MEQNIEQFTYVTSCQNGLCELQRREIKYNNDGKKSHGEFYVQKNKNSIFRTVRNLGFEDLVHMVNQSEKSLSNMLKDNMDFDTKTNIVPMNRRKKSKRTNPANKTVRAKRRR